MAKLFIVIPIFLLTLFIREAELLRCWICSSDLNPLCNDPFNLEEVRYLFKLHNCDVGSTYPYLTSSKSTCIKQKKIIQGTEVVSRGCAWKRNDDNTSFCPVTSISLNEVRSYCKTCDYDGCNSY